eukprot:1119210-Prorocentrum_minimum.AAC.1
MVLTLEGRGQFQYKYLQKKPPAHRVQSSPNAFMTALYKVRANITGGRPDSIHMFPSPLRQHVIFSPFLRSSCRRFALDVDTFSSGWVLAILVMRV